MNDLRKYYLDQPNEVSLETLALCNAACTFCPYPTLERKGLKMSDMLIDKVLDEFHTFEKPFFFSPFKVNEPLLDKRLYDICSRTPEHCLIRLFTNGAALTDKNIDKIAELERIEHLWVSLNAVDADKYEALMSIPFERTANNLDRLHARAFPHTVVLSAVGRTPGFREYCNSRWPRFYVVIIEKSGWLGYTDPEIETVPDTPCSRWFELSIMASGVVSLCCMDGTGEYAIGDINESSLLEVYNAPHWRERREKMISRREIAPCDRCTY